jgi:signal transduction histidine kinase
MAQIAGEYTDRTEILYGTDLAVKRGIEFMKKVESKMDICFDKNGASIVTEVEAYRNGYIGIRKRDGRIRALTEINNDNLRYCKDLTGIVDELRHLDGLRGGIAINDSEYMAATVLEAAKPLTQVIYSNAKEMVEQGQYIFDALWGKGVPAEQRIREIEHGMLPEFIETISDPHKVLSLGSELVKAARSEILVILSTTNAFHRLERAGYIQLLFDAAIRGVSIRLLTPQDDDSMRSTVRQAQWKVNQHISFRLIEPSQQTKISLLVVDRSFSLAVELRDDTKKTSPEAIGLATYSNSKATVLSYVSIFESLWSQTILYEHLHESHEKLKLNERIQREFLDVAAHELRTPIQPIIGLASVLRENADPDRCLELLDVIIRNAQRLHRITENILDVTKIEGHTLPLRRELFNLTDLVASFLKDVKKSSSLSSQCRLELPASSRKRIMINGDKSRIEQVISNLIDNAAKFTRKGVITVEVKKESRKNEVTVSVRDTGDGIDLEVMPRLFEKFASRSYKGTGLGLFISKGIIEAHQGRIWGVNNSDGPGATFSFTLPVAAD